MSKTFDQQERGNARPGKTSYGDPRAIEKPKASPNATTAAHPITNSPSDTPAEKSESPSYGSMHSAGKSWGEIAKSLEAKAAAKGPRPKTAEEGRIAMTRHKLAQAESRRMAKHEPQADQELSTKTRGRNKPVPPGTHSVVETMAQSSSESQSEVRGKVYELFEDARTVVRDQAKKGVRLTMRKNSSGDGGWRVE